MKWLAQIAWFTRWRDWGPGKVTVLCSLCFYIAAAYRIPFHVFVPSFAAFLVFASAQSALGFVLNDWGDRDLDGRQGKANVFLQISAQQGSWGLALVWTVALVAGLPFLWRPGFVPLWLVWMFCAVAYSLEPLRLKTRGAAGLVCSFTAQWLLPVPLAFVTLAGSGGLDMALLMLALTISGATLELGHQRHDRVRDSAAQAKTFATRLSAGAMDRAYAWSLVLDKLAVGLVLGVATFGMVQLGSGWALLIAGGLWSIYGVLMVATLPTALLASSGGIVPDPYYSSDHPAARLLHETLPNFGVPAALVAATTLAAPEFIVVLVVFVVWRVVLGGANWRRALRTFRIRAVHGR